MNHLLLLVNIFKNNSQFNKLRIISIILGMLVSALNSFELLYFGKSSGNISKEISLSKT